MFYNKDTLKKCVKFTEKRLCWGHFYIKVGLSPSRKNCVIWLIKSPLKAPLQTYLLPESNPSSVINEFFYLKEKQCFVLEITRVLCFWGIHKFQNL